MAKKWALTEGDPEKEREALKRAAEQTEPPALPPPPSTVPASSAGTFDLLDTRLTPEDLNNPGTQKLVLHLLAKAEKENRELKDELKEINKSLSDLRDKHHKVDNDLVAERATSAKNTGWEIFTQIALVGSGLLLGTAMSGQSPEITRKTFILGIVMLIGPLAAGWFPALLLRIKKSSK
jgi:hypothetical protein